MSVRRSPSTPAVHIDVSNGPPSTAGSWSDRYGSSHRLVRVDGFPAGIIPPKRVRIYARGDHYVLQWWDPTAKRTLCERVNGDLVTAIARVGRLTSGSMHFVAVDKAAGVLVMSNLSISFWLT